MKNHDPKLDELKKISKILTLAHAESIERELSKIASSTERKKMWVLIDGERMSTDIAEIVGVTKRSVDRFLKIATTAELIENPWGKPPRRIINYVPPEWIELVKIPEKAETEESK